MDICLLALFFILVYLEACPHAMSKAATRYGRVRRKRNRKRSITLSINDNVYRIPRKQRASPFLNFSQALERTVKDRSQDNSAEYNRRRTRSITRVTTRTNPKRQTCNLMINAERIPYSVGEYTWETRCCRAVPMRYLNQEMRVRAVSCGAGRRSLSRSIVHYHRPVGET